ncbi:MAG: alpha/beta hydrolase [Anaerolineaceae bacterium]|nr:alpha/beta hydrolase [Anaerolineaceae bacterium]
MIDSSKLIYLHGLESTSQSGKARQFAQKYPGMLTPDFTGSFTQRMDQLYPILGETRDWTIIGSSFGGLMGAVFTCGHPEQVRRLILLAPALILPEFKDAAFTPVNTPTVLIHGMQDEIVPPKPVQQIARRIFTNLQYIPVEDGHRLQKSFSELDWDNILS